VERAASVRESQHLLLTRPRDRCVEKAGDIVRDYLALQRCGAFFAANNHARGVDREIPGKVG
jgi:hypothetical protein